jgi:hypothetical protein
MDSTDFSVLKTCIEWLQKGCPRHRGGNLGIVAAPGRLVVGHTR